MMPDPATPAPLPLNGILLVDKPPEWTSHDVVNCAKYRVRPSKVGHCGTLDPMATGLLIVVVGKATRLSETLMGHDKTYQGTLRLGLETDSQDTTGQVTAEHDWSGVTEAQVREVFAAFVGPQLQLPPMVSAIKKDGKPLYKLARQGKEVERTPRPIIIRSFEVTAIRLPEVDFTVVCTKGTYVRTLCADIGTRLGCGGTMSALRRTRSGDFDVANAVTVEEMKTWTREDWERHLIPIPPPGA